MKKVKAHQILFLLLAFLLVLAGCSSTTATEAKETTQRPILIQGPMPIEAEKFAERLENVKAEESGSTFEFYSGTVEGYPVIVVKTGKGMANTGAATALAIEKYNPAAIINQGTSGGHDPALNVFDIVLGKRSVNIGALKTGDLVEGEGIEPTEWKPMDLMASEGSAGEDPDAENIEWLYKPANAKKFRLDKKADGTFELALLDRKVPFSYHLRARS